MATPLLLRLISHEKTTCDDSIGFLLRSSVTRIVRLLVGLVVKYKYT